MGADHSRRGGIRAVVALGKPIGLFLTLKEPPPPDEMKAPTLLAVARHRGTEISNPFSFCGESDEMQYGDRAM